MFGQSSADSLKQTDWRKLVKRPSRLLKKPISLGKSWDAEIALWQLQATLNVFQQPARSLVAPPPVRAPRTGTFLSRPRSAIR
jgi:hypothetical protein